MKMNSQLSFMFLGFALSLSACSVETKMEGGDPGRIFPESPSAGLEGRWTSGCQAANGQYQIETMEFGTSAGLHMSAASGLPRFKTDIAMFGNPTCAGQPIFTMTIDGTYAVRGASGTVPGAFDVDVTMGDQGQAATYYLVGIVEGTKLYLPSSEHDSTRSRATSVDRAKPYTKIGG